MQAHVITSEVFQCRYCAADVALVTLPGGELAYECVSPRCGHTVHVDCPEALDVKAELAETIVAIDYSSTRLGALPFEPTAAERKAAWHAAQGVAAVRHGDGWLVPSGSRTNVIHFVSAAGVCSCEAHGPCWHQALVELQASARRAA